MHFFEALMLICFGISWPISIFKSLYTRVVDGKSPYFLIIVMIGYFSGIIHKFINSPDWVTWLYFLNFVMVGTDLYLYFKYRTTTNDSIA